MFFSKAQIIRSLKELENVHPFYGVTFLTCKKNNLPVGDSIHFSINHLEEEFLNTYYKPDQGTSWYYRPFRVSDKTQHWWRYDYPSSGSQSTRTRKFSDAFIHEKNTDIWGWKNNYVEVLHREMGRKMRLDAFDLAVWLYRDVDWEPQTTMSNVVRRFLYEFSITSDEFSTLFITRPQGTSNIFSPEPTLWEDIRESLGSPPPPDAQLDEGGSLRMLLTENTGPAERLEINFSNRINIITGDNGLGKTFLLETAWWALTGDWSGNPMYPSSDFLTDSRIIFQIASPSNRVQTIASSFDWKSQSWVLQTPRSVKSGLVIYARVDGSFSIWDPLRTTYSGQTTPLHFSKKDVWDGLKSKEFFNDRFVCNGLINDWAFWQNNPAKTPFQVLEKVLTRISPSEEGDLGILKPGQPIRVPNESRLIPTINHSYGTVPLTLASEAVKRVVALAYLIVWTWSEHQTQADITRDTIQKKMVVIIDEIESHLHPQWQRLILPALNKALHELGNGLSIQIISTTHSPLVLSSLEPEFDDKEDSIFHLNINQRGKQNKVIIEAPEFVKYGTADSWLKSPFFEMPQAIAEPYEKIIERAKQYMASDKNSKDEIISVSKDLLSALPNHDLLVLRWRMYAQKHGVTL